MIQKTGFITLLIKDFNEAIEFYTKKFGFVVVDDMQTHGMRWVTVAPQKNSETVYSLMQLPPQYDSSMIGKQCGMAPMAILITDDCRKEVAQMKARGVEVVKDVTDEFWGVDAWVKDLYGNVFNLVQMPTGK